MRTLEPAAVAAFFIQDTNEINHRIAASELLGQDILGLELLSGSLPKLTLGPASVCARDSKVNVETLKFRPHFTHKPSDFPKTAITCRIDRSELNDYSPCAAQPPLLNPMETN